MVATNIVGTSRIHSFTNEMHLFTFLFKLIFAKGYTAPDSAQSTEPNSLASIDQPDSSLRTSSKHSNKLHHSTANSININNNNNHNTSNSNSNSIAGTTSKSISNNGGNSSSITTTNNNNNNNHVRYSNAIPAINTMSSKTSSKSASSNSHQYSSITNHSSTSSTAMASITSSTASYETTVRKSPEGKDNDSYHIEDTKGRISANNSLAKHNNNGQVAAGSNGINAGQQKIGNDISTEIFSASNDNGKINVQVTVLVGEFAITFFFSLSFSPPQYQHLFPLLLCPFHFRHE